MTEYNQQEQEATQARVKTARWSPWVWIVPALAILFVGWLIVRYGFFGGGDITVRFVEARGLDRYSPVRFRGAKVGTVQKITIDEDLRQVVVRITMDASMSHALRKNTRFWIVEPGLEGGGLGGILSGTYVGISPGGGEETREFVGQEYPPVLYAPEAGRTFILDGPGVGSIVAGAPVQFQGIRVGRVLGAEYNERRGTASVHVWVAQRFQHHVRTSTRFYRGGGLNFSLSGGGVSMGAGASLSSLLNQPIEFYTPDVMAGAEAPELTRFELHTGRTAAIAASDGPHLTYLTYFRGPVGGLAPGTPVTMKGIQVGYVRDVQLRYVPASASLETPVVLAIDPREIGLDVNASTTYADLRGRMNSALARLVQKGLRATLATSLVLPGASAVTLDIVAAPNTARLGLASDPPIIPSSESAGIGGAMAAITDVANTIRSLPLREIAGHIRSTAARLDTLVQDPALDQSIQRLNRSLAEVERVATMASQNAGPILSSVRRTAESAEAASQQIGPLVESLRNAAASAEAAAKSAEQLMGTSQKQNYDVAELIRELTRAAEAVRALANYLTENPDALLKGRKQ